jgi:hypothetical protein
MDAQREYKDGILRRLFNEPKKALKLYGDIIGKTFDPDTPIEVKTLDNIFFSKIRNDLAFIVNDVLVVMIEFQTTFNRNMPLRMLQYVLHVYLLLLNIADALYRGKQIKLPKPEFYMLYDGKEPCTVKVMRLSDAFEGLAEGEPPNLELLVKVIDIKSNSDSLILQRNKEMKEYAAFVEKVHTHEKAGLPLNKSLREAMRECIAEGILTDFFKIHEREVDALFSLMYDEKRHMEIIREEAREDALEEGLLLGMEKGMDQSILIIKALKRNEPIESIAEHFKQSVKKIMDYRDALIN